MARKAKVSNNTLLRFVAMDDESIGCPENYDAYLETANENLLELKDDDVSFYWLKPLSSRLWMKAVPVLESAADGNIDFDSLFVLQQEVIDRCIVGCAQHVEVAKVNEDGSFELNEFRWMPGTEKPKGVMESIKGDDVLISNIFNFLMNAAALKETEKNR